MQSFITIQLEGLSEDDTLRCKEIIDKLFVQRVFNISNGSAELFFDDIGELAEIRCKKKRRRREGETLKVLDMKNGSATAHYNQDGQINSIEYETIWKRKFDTGLPSAII